MKSDTSKYEQLVAWFREALAEGRLNPGERLPSEYQFGERFGVSRQTVRHALDVLAGEGLIVRRQGSGSYVREVSWKHSEERSGQVAVMSTFVDAYIFPPVLKGIEAALAEAGCVMQLYFTGNRISREREILAQLLESRQIDGLIVEPSKSALPNPNLELYRRMQALKVPILFFNSSYPELGLPMVAMDDEQIGLKAVRYLLGRGHRRIGAVFKCDDGQGKKRYLGYAQGLLSAGLALDNHRVFWVDSLMMEEPEAWVDYMLRRMKDCTALLCYNDELAYRLAERLAQRGVRVPEELSLVGIDCLRMPGASGLDIHSFPHPLEALGRCVGEQMLQLIEHPFSPAGRLFDVDIHEGNSVRDIAHPTAEYGEA